jgi:phosphoenolpyruvate carboxykinase (GTP)
MLPFCGYNMADYFAHWLSFEDRLTAPPKIFQVNWFRKGSNGKFLWPGFAENSRVIEWITNRLIGASVGVETPIGLVPAKGELNLKGIDVSENSMRELFDLNTDAWLDELSSMDEFFDSFGPKLPVKLRGELQHTRERFSHHLSYKIAV